MYRYTVPLDTMTFAASNREGVAKTLHEMKVSRVMLCGSSYFYDPDVKKVFLDTLREDCKFLKAAGFEVGAWKWTFMDLRPNTEFTRMRLLSGKDSAQSVCPSDPEFRKFAAEFICEIAKCGVDLIMFDDDFRYGNLESSMGCLCDNHLAYMSELLGEEIIFEDIRDKLAAGGKNKYRTAWLKAKRHFFEVFAREMRDELNKIAPKVRLGLCSSYCSWDQDGITPYEVAKILGENTKPFLRLSGAPFWAARKSPDNQTLQDTIEFSRMQLSFIKEGDCDIEVFSEDDSYPRPRQKCPASYIEGFDQALRVSGGTDGILKYTMDYTASERYETGYNERHIINLPLYEKLDGMFASKECIGVRAFEFREKYENAYVPPYITKERELEFMTAFSYASRMLTAATIPIVYNHTDTVGIAFGENAKYVPRSEFKNGLILDAKAAEILTERGIDVGLRKIGKRYEIVAERFNADNELISVNGFAYDFSISERAKVDSTFTTFDSSNQTMPLMMYNVATFDARYDIIGSYTYENANGERFLVFTFDGQLANETLFRSYARADQLKRIIPCLGKSCGITVCTSPQLYALAKQESNRVAVGLWNFFEDSVESPWMRPDGTSVRILSTINCTATISDGIIKLSRMEPFGFAAVEYEIT